MGIMVHSLFWVLQDLYHQPQVFGSQLRVWVDHLKSSRTGFEGGASHAARLRLRGRLLDGNIASVSFAHIPSGIMSCSTLYDDMTMTCNVDPWVKHALLTGPQHYDPAHQPYKVKGGGCQIRGGHRYLYVGSSLH